MKGLKLLFLSMFFGVGMGNCMTLEKTEPRSENWSVFFNASLDYIE